jgi:hypothetical protein
MNKPYAQFVERTIRSNPVFLIGSGLSAGAGLATMGQLADYLVRHVRIGSFSKPEREEWVRIQHRLTVEKRGLEEVLQQSGAAVSGPLLREIVRQTWRCLSEDEQKRMPDIASGVDPTGFGRYFRTLKHSNHAIVHVITTNYDHLIEWSASASGWRVWDGFEEGAIGSPLSVAELNESMTRISGYGKRRVTTHRPHLRIYKPHGSLSWFKYPDGQIKRLQGAGLQLLPMLARAGIVPAIVTPGTGKYLETHRDPYNSVLAEMRSVLDERRPLVIVGFGFNDLHIQGSFEAVLRSEGVPKIVLARQLSDSAKALIRDRRIRNYIAVQKEGSGSRIVSDAVASFSAPEPDLWTFHALLDQAWGAEADAGTSESV